MKPKNPKPYTLNPFYIASPVFCSHPPIMKAPMRPLEGALLSQWSAPESVAQVDARFPVLGFGFGVQGLGFRV